MNAELRPYQRPHVERLESILATRGIVHDGSDCGTGKTFCAAAVIARLKLEPLVICPIAVIETWQRVLSSFGVKATVINYESAWRKLGVVKPWGAGSFFEWSQRWPLFVYDESHRTAGETSMQSKMMIASVRQKTRILSLSATAAHSPAKLRALGFALGLHGLSNYRDWILSYGYVWKEIKLGNGRKFKKLTISTENQQKAMRLLNDQIFGAGRRGSRMAIADIPNFPKTQYEVRLLRRPDESIAKMSDELRAFYAERVMKAAMSEDDLAKQVFLRQSLEVAKIPQLADMIEDAMEHSRVAVFCNFNRTLDELLAIATKNGWSHGVIRGAMDPDIRARTIIDFQRNRLDVIFCNIQAGGVAVSLHDDLTQVPRTCLICPTYNAVDLKQVLGRAHRDGGGFSQQFLVYFAGTHEERVARSVNRKIDCIDLLNDGELNAGDDQAEENLALQSQ